jgi:LysM repeat protein
MKSRKISFISVALVAVLLVIGMTACTRAKPIRPSVSEAPTSVPGAGVTGAPTGESAPQIPTAEVVGVVTSSPAGGEAVAPGGVIEITPLILEPSPTAVPGMPTSTPEGGAVLEIPTPGVTLIIPLTPEVELPPTSTPAPQTADGKPGQIYIVKEQDTLFSISVRFGTSIEEIMAANNMIDDLLSIGQELIIPVPPSGEQPALAPTEMAAPAEPAAGVVSEPRPALTGDNVYVVQAGDNLFRIALKFNVSMDAIAQANNIVPPWYVIYTGQRLVIPQ